MNHTLSFWVRTGLLVVLSLSLSPVFGQDLNELETQVDKAQEFYDLQQYDSARYYVDLALTAFTETSNKTDLFLRLKDIDIETDLQTRNYDALEEKVKEYSIFLKTYFPENVRHRANLLTVEALKFAQTQNFREASPYFHKAIKMRRNEKNRRDLTTAQANHNTTRLANNYLWLANTKWELNDSDSAVVYYNYAIELYESEGISHPRNLAASYRGLSFFHFYRRELDQSMSFAKKALNAYNHNDDLQKSNIQNTYLLVANLHKQKNNLDSALVYMNLSLAINKEMLGPGDLRIAISMQNIATIYNAKEDFFKAEKLLEDALDIALNSTKKDPVFLMYLYNSLAHVSLEKYYAPQAGLDYLNEILKLISNSERTPRTTSMEVDALQTASASYLSRAIYNQNSGSIEAALADYEISIQNINKAIKLELELTEGNFHGTINAYNSLASAHRVFKEYELSEKTYFEALEFSKKFKNDPVINPALVTLYMGLSDLYHRQGDLLKFEKYWKMALEFIDDVKEAKGEIRSRVYNQIGSNYRELGESDKARSFISKAIDSNITVSRDSLSPEKIRQQSYSFLRFTESIFQLSRIAEEEYLTNDSLEILKKAQEYYKDYVNYIMAIVSSTKNQNDIIDQTAFYNNGFQGLARTSFELFQKTGETRFKEEAFEASQLSRSLLLKNSVAQKGNRSFAQVPDSLLAEEYSAEADVEYHSSRLQSAKLNGENDTTIGDIQSQVFQTKLRKQNIRKVLSQKYPGYYELRYSTNLASSKQLQESLSDNETFIEYLNGEEEILAFVVTRRNFEILSLPKKSGFDSLVNSFSNTLKLLNEDRTDKYLLDLYSTLLSPIKPHIKGDKLTIVPDGSLWNINFDLLKSQSGQYLLENYSVSHAYSATSHIGKGDKSTNKKKLLAFSFGNKENMALSTSTMRDESLKELPGSAKEIFNLSEFLPGDYFYKNKTTESTFKKLAPDYNVLHLAIHGQIDELSYDRSRLYFDTDGQDTINDGLLYPFELYNMELNADLAVLSACNSGGGRIARGEGIMSLGRAFQYAGVNSLLLSKWEVSDAVAPEIITSFYQNLDQGMSKDEALRNAKLTYLERADNLTKSPYYWGSFFVLGDPKPIKLQSGVDYTKVAIIFFLFIFSSMIAFRIRMKKKLNANKEVVT